MAYVLAKDKDELTLQEKLIMVFQVSSYDGGFDNLRYEENNEHFFDAFYPTEAYQAVKAASLGSYKFSDPFVRFNSRDELESATGREVEAKIDKELESLVSTYVKLVNDEEIPDFDGLCVSEEEKEIHALAETPGIRATIEANKEKAATKESAKPSKEHAIGEDR